MISAMENIEATTELQSRLASLSVSSFPGITSNNWETNPLDRLQSTDLSKKPSNADMDETKEPKGSNQSDEGNQEAPEQQAMGDDLENSSGDSQNPGEGKAQLPLLNPPSTWTSMAMKELKAKLRLEKDSVVTVYRGDIMTVHVPTVPEGKRVCWEFATDNYDIGFGIYFDWTPVTSRAITVHISESSDDEDEEDVIEAPTNTGDVEKGSKSQANSNLGEILPVYRQDSHLAVQGGSHDNHEGVDYTYTIGQWRISEEKNMGKLHFFVLWSLCEAPRQFIRKSNPKFHQVHVPFPLPKQFVVFCLGEWKFLSSETTISVDVLVSQDVKPHRIGTLSALTRCLTWEGSWNPDLVKEATEKGRRGVYGKILLTVCGENDADFISSTPLVPRKCSSPVDLNNSHLSQSPLNTTGIHRISTPNSSPLKNICYAEIKAETTEINDSTLSENPCVWPTNKTPRRTVIGKRGRFSWSPEHSTTPQKETSQGSISKRSKLSDFVDMSVKRKPHCKAVCPSKRWSHSMVLSDPTTAIIIGGEAFGQIPCQDSLWKLEMENDFWIQMNSLTSGNVPTHACGHSANFDPESKALYVYGGLRDSQRYSDLYILNTLTWKWKVVTAKGDVPMLAYHSATFYNKELFVFGGIHPNHFHGGKTCSNALYIFNPEFEVWYQPIIEGLRPLPRYGHSGTLLSNQLLIFGGRMTASYLNDLHILDLGFMEYTAVKYENMPPLPRGYHAALPVSNNKMMISGGCSAIGALQDIHIFNVDTSMWSSVVSPLLYAKPRAGHSMIHLEGSVLSNTDKQEQGNDANTPYTIMLFGGSDCAGTFYNDIVKCTLEISDDK
ncbi:hypothetical protein DPEC_G00311190 [Dallia pectoralis]|uniref:Uncharacterized protein n=1 Tax=Dallia pectoralis TaxID=75939 RepID=A0ACC2FB25_DALPE|nr:hypothetical protein DPEC_G00311190 [Dallia pectoralis]